MHSQRYFLELACHFEECTIFRTSSGGCPRDRRLGQCILHSNVRWPTTLVEKQARKSFSNGNKKEWSQCPSTIGTGTCDNVSAGKDKQDCLVSKCFAFIRDFKNHISLCSLKYVLCIISTYTWINKFMNKDKEELINVGFKRDICLSYLKQCVETPQHEENNIPRPTVSKTTSDLKQEALSFSNRKISAESKQALLCKTNSILSRTQCDTLLNVFCSFPPKIFGEQGIKVTSLYTV